MRSPNADTSPSKHRVAKKSLMTFLVSFVVILMLPLFIRFEGAWPSGELTVAATNSDWTPLLQKAISGWNRADTGVRFNLIQSVQDADIVVETGNIQQLCGSTKEVACTQRVGWIIGSPQNAIFMPPASSGAGELLAQGYATQTLVHELGHAIGLNHRAGCSVMNIGIISECSPTIQTQIDRKQGPLLPKQSCRSDYPSFEAAVWNCYDYSKLRFVCGPLASDLTDAEYLYGGLGSQSEGYNPICWIRVWYPPLRLRTLKLQEGRCGHANGIYKDLALRSLCLGITPTPDALKTLEKKIQY